VQHVPTLDEWLDRLSASCKREQGQTMAEYGVVMAVITVASVAVFTALSGGVQGTLNRVIGLFPA
jgi:Flp pilus assembly pilin Flp